METCDAIADVTAFLHRLGEGRVPGQAEIGGEVDLPAPASARSGA